MKGQCGIALHIWALKVSRHKYEVQLNHLTLSDAEQIVFPL